MRKKEMKNDKNVQKKGERKNGTQKNHKERE